HHSGPQPKDPSLRGLAVAVRSVVRYRGDGHAVIVLLNEPSPLAIQNRKLLLGEHTVRLPNGQPAWASSGTLGVPFIVPREGANNTLAWVSGHYVVSLWGNVSQATLQRLAVGTAVVPPRPAPFHRHIPANWPAPRPLDGLPSHLAAVMTGSVLYRQFGSTVHVTYQFDATTYSRPGLYGLLKWHHVRDTILFPPALRRRIDHPVPHQTFSGDFGVGGDVKFAVSGIAPARLRRVLRQGVTVRLAWEERGRPRRQTFHFKFAPGKCAGGAGCPFLEPAG
ncbi:MAG: hypothetical protein ACRDFX_04525, partial [Chloroflexota bacterium]